MSTTKRQTKSGRRGRHAKIPTTELGLFIQQRLDTMNITRTELAKRLKVSASTIVRMLNGDTRVIQRVRPENICEALELDEMNRRSFFKLASSAGFALATGAIIPKVIIRHTIDLDLANHQAKFLQHLLDQGSHVQEVIENAQFWYDKLMQEDPHTKDMHLAIMQIGFGMILGSAQYFALPFYQRPRAIRVFNAVESRILRLDIEALRFKDESVPIRREYAGLLSQRAQLYRDFSQRAPLDQGGTSSNEYLVKSDADYDMCIFWAEHVNDPLLLSMPMRQRFHNSAILGEKKIWEHQIEKAYEQTHQINADYREGALALINCTKAEGYKRLAFTIYKEFPKQTRIEYAQRAFYGLGQSLADLEHSSGAQNLLQLTVIERSLLAYSLLVKVDQAQCLILVDPEEAVNLIEQIWNDTVSFYPALLPKLKRTFRFAKEQLQQCGSNPPNPLRLFIQDARTR